MKEKFKINICSEFHNIYTQVQVPYPVHIEKVVRVPVEKIVERKASYIPSNLIFN